MSTPLDKTPATPVDGGQADLLQQIADLEAKLAANERASTAAAAPATGGPVSEGDVILHDVYNHATASQRTQALVVIGQKSVRVNPDDPDDNRRTTKVYAVPLGYVDELHSVPATAPVPVIAAGAYAEFGQADYRRQ